MLKYKNVKFLQLFAKKCSLLITFVKFLQFSATFCTLFRRFFLAIFTQTTHATNQHLFLAQKQTSLREEPKKTAISPQFLKFKKFNFSIMLICATLSTAISTGTKNCAFGSRQNKLAVAPVPGQFKAKQSQFQRALSTCVAVVIAVTHFLL